MENRSFLSKIIVVIIIIVVLSITIFFFVNKNTVDENMSKVEAITSANVNTYDEDLYIYKIEDNKIYTSQYFYNKIYLSNNNVKYDEYNITEDTKFYLRTLSNTSTDISNIKISFDPITIDEFNYLLENYTLLKVYIWLDEDNNIKNIMLYSSNNIELIME